MSAKGVDVVRRLFEAQGDVDAVYSLFDPNIEWEDASGLWSADWGTARGTEELREAWRRWFGIFDEVDFDPEEFTEVGDNVLVTVHVRARARVSQVPVAQRLSVVFTVRGGLICRVRGYRDESEALEALRD